MRRSSGEENKKEDKDEVNHSNNHDDGGGGGLADSLWAFGIGLAGARGGTADRRDPSTQETGHGKYT